jgi:hypothetical protein
VARLSIAGNCVIRCTGAGAVAGLIEVDVDAVSAQIEEIGHAGAIDIGQPNASVVEQIRPVEPGRVIHRDLLAEPSIAEIGPVADFSIPDAHEICKPIARHIGEIDRLGAVVKDQPIERSDVVLGNRTPVNLAVALPRPPLDASEKPPFPFGFLPSATVASFGFRREVARLIQLL